MTPITDYQAARDEAEAALLNGGKFWAGPISSGSLKALLAGPPLPDREALAHEIEIIFDREDCEPSYTDLQRRCSKAADAILALLKGESK